MTWRPWVAALAAALVAGCAGPQIYHGQLSTLDKGLSPDTVQARLKLPPLSVHTAKAAGRTFDFHRFRMNNGMQVDLYLLAYEGDRLVYWGYVPEFRRLQDRPLNEALSAVLPEILAAK